MRQGCNLSHTTDREAARTNRNCDSGNRGNGGINSSRRARCRMSGRRASNYRRDNESWAAIVKTNNNLNNQTIMHEDIVRMVSSHTANRSRATVTDEEVERWTEKEEYEKTNGYEMNRLERELVAQYPVDVAHHGSLMSEEREDGVFRGLMVQLNSISTKKVRNRKAAQLQWLVRKYDIQLVGLGEVGVNWSTCRHKKRLLTLLPELERSAKSCTAHNARVGERHGIRQQGGVGMLLLNDIIPYSKKGGKDFRDLG